MKNLFKKIGALLVAAVMVLSMCSTVSVFAENTKPLETDNATATVKNVEATATVTAYHIVKGVYNNSGLVGYKAAEGVKITNLYNPTEKEIADVSKNVSNLESVSMHTKATEGLADFTANLTAGTWMVLVTGTVDEVYNPMIVSINYKTEADDSTSSGSNNELQPGEVDANSNWGLSETVAYAKSTKPSIDKEIVGSTTAEGTSNTDASLNNKGNDVAVGDIVNYQIKTNIPSYSKQYTEVIVKISDTLSEGLTLNTESIKINGKAVDSNMGSLTSTASGFDFIINSDYALAHGKDEVTVTYSATVNNQAKKNFDPNTNTAKLVYSNDPSTKEKTKETESKTYTYTFSIGAALSASIQNYSQKINQIVKVDADGKVISTSKKESNVEADKVIEVKSGAEFTLTNKATGKAYTAVTGADGGLTFEGLDAGEYTLVETKAPAGFTLSNKEIPVVIAATYTTEGRLATLTITIDGEKTSTYTATYNKEGTVDTISNTTVVTNVTNTKLSSLPSTGGMGTYLFTIIGVVVMAGAAGAFFISRRKGSEE